MQGFLNCLQGSFRWMYVGFFWVYLGLVWVSAGPCGVYAESSVCRALADSFGCKYGSFSVYKALIGSAAT